MGRWLTPDDQMLIKKFVDKGWDTERIARFIKCSRSTVNRTINRCNIERDKKNRKWKKPLLDELVRMWNEGKSAMVCAEHFDTSPRCIYMYISKERRRRGSDVISDRRRICNSV